MARPDFKQFLLEERRVLADTRVSAASCAYYSLLNTTQANVILAARSDLNTALASLELLKRQTTSDAAFDLCRETFRENVGLFDVPHLAILLIVFQVIGGLTTTCRRVLRALDHSTFDASHFTWDRNVCLWYPQYIHSALVRNWNATSSVNR